MVKKIRQFHAASHPNGLIDPNINGGEIANRLTLIGWSYLLGFKITNTGVTLVHATTVATIWLRLENFLRKVTCHKDGAFRTVKIFSNAQISSYLNQSEDRAATSMYEYTERLAFRVTMFPLKLVFSLRQLRICIDTNFTFGSFLLLMSVKLA